MKNQRKTRVRSRGRNQNVRRAGNASLALVLRAPQMPGSRHLGRLILDGRAYACALGRSGITGLKREGDGATPRSTMAVLAGHFRADRVRRPSANQPFWSRINADDGWCDAPFTPTYNSKVTLPCPVSHEVMTREDALYDHLIVLDWNVRTRKQACGSAIFMHQARVDAGQLKPTEGCVAIPAAQFAKLAPRLARLGALRVM